jgi:hypothetical protein
MVKTIRTAPHYCHRHSLKDVCVECFAAGLAVLGAAVGVIFRLKVLLPIIGVLLCASIIFSISRGLSFLDAALVVVVAQAILQAGYFAGLFVRHVIASACLRSALWSPRGFGGRRGSEIRRKDQSTANPQPPANSGDLT